MPEPNIADTLTAYVKLRDAIEAKEREVKEFKASVKTAMANMELFFKGEMERQGLDKFSAGGMTAFKTTKDSVKIEDKVVFREMLAKTLVQQLVTSGRLGYVTWGPEDDGLVAELSNSEAFDLLTLSANKTNCKTFMADNNGLMPAGVGYTKIDVIQVRRS